MAEYPQPGGEQRSQQSFLIFDRFKGVNTQLARTGLPNNELAWLENLQPLAENKLQVVPAPLPPAVIVALENIVLEFYATMKNQDWLILFTAAGGGFYYNVTTNVSGEFAPDGTFSTTPDCTTWQAARILINDSIAGYCTWDGTTFVQQGGLSPNIQVTNGGANYGTPPPVSITGPLGHAGIAIAVVTAGSWTTSPPAGVVNLTIGAPPPGGMQAVATATVTATAGVLSVTGVTIIDAGSGYTSAPAVSMGAVTGGAATPATFMAVLAANGATAHAVIVNGQVTQVVLDNPGSGFLPGDTVVVSFGTTTGSGAAIAVRPGAGGAPGANGMSGAGLTSIIITDVGQFAPFFFNPAAGPGPGGSWPLLIDPPVSGGVQAVASVTTISNPAGNTCNAIIISNVGSGYAHPPVVRWNDTTAGNGVVRYPTFLATMGSQHVQAPLAINAAGTGYPVSTNVPLVFNGGGATTQATGFATTDGSGTVISTTLQTGGSYPLGGTPTITVAAGSGATASAHVWPFVPAGTTLAVFQSRVFLGGGQLLQWSGTGASPGYNNQGFDDFLVADLAGALQIVDADLVHSITALRSFNNYLWIVGDQSIKQIGSLFPTGAPPFQLLTLSSDQGSKWPKSCISYNRIFLFANRNGIFGVFGSTVQKISDDLDGIFQNTVFGAGLQGAVVDLNSKHNAVFLTHYNDPAGLRSLLLMFDGKAWWFANQGSGLVAIATVPTLTPHTNQLWGSVTGADVTQLLADPTTAQPFKLSTALAHNNNPVQGKRLIRGGFTADSGDTAAVNMLLEADKTNLARLLGVTGGSLLVGGANDANNAPLSIAGVYLGATLTGTLADFTLENVVLEYQETSLWKAGVALAVPPVKLVSPIISSSGVFDANGNLVRTIWSAQADDPRARNLQATVWDGALDDGTVAPTGKYTIQLLENNVSYAWEGVIGNSSPDHSVSLTQVPGHAAALNYYHSYGGNVWDMTITAAGEIYFTTAYDERLHTVHVATESNPQRVTTVLGQSFRDSWVAQHACCNDNTNLYLAWQQAGVSFVWGINCSTKLPTVFSAGVPSTSIGYTYYQIGTVSDVVSGDGTNFISDIAVQRGGNFLFIARSALNSIYTLNKTTGAVVQTFTGFATPLKMDTNPVTGDLWVAHIVSSSVAPSWDPSTATDGLLLSNSNLTVTSIAPINYAYSSGSGTKVYFEVVVNAAGGGSFSLDVGVVSSLTRSRNDGFLGFDANSFGFFMFGGYSVNGVEVNGTVPGFGPGDNVGIAVDIANHLIWMRVNGGPWNGSGLANPATGAGGIATSTLGSPVLAALSTNTVIGVQATAHFSAASWVYAVPAGYSALPGVLRSSVVSKMTVDGSGNLTDTGIAITGLQSALDVAVSPDGSMVLVADGAGAQQVKAFNSADGSVKAAWGTSGALGVAGGYATGPAVTNNKFMFNSFLGASGAGKSSFVAFSSDSSFWLGDPGNCRYLHFSAGNSPTYIEQISYLPLFYSTWVCYNDPTRVFGGYLEFKIDYSKPLAIGNGSWTLVNNWFFGAGAFQTFSAMRYTITGTNGRTYVPLAGIIFEMTATGYRSTGVSVSYDYIDRDFNLWGIAQTDPGAAAVFKVNRFKGFDGSNNPTWTTDPASPPSTVSLTTAIFPPTFPSLGNPVGENNTSNYVERLANGIIPVHWVHSTGPGPSSQFHFGGIDSATGNIKFAAHPPIPNNQGGINTFLIFAPAPHFNNSVTGPGAGGANGVGDNGGGFQCYVPGTADVFTLYRGESWGQNQTAVWSHWHQSGLLVNRTGVAAPYFGQFSSTLTPPAVRLDTIDAIDANPLGLAAVVPNVTTSFMGTPGLSGNSAFGGIALQNNDYFLYNGDEWYHGGVHRWHISNLDKIRFSSVAVDWNAASFVPRAVTPRDFLAALPFNTVNLPSGTGNWVRNPTSDLGSGIFDIPLFRMYTNAIICDRNLSPDLVFEASILNSTATASYSWTRVKTGNWALSGAFFQDSYGLESNNIPGEYLFIDILDNTGKKLVRMHNLQKLSEAGAGNSFFVNGNPIRPPVIDSLIWANYVKRIQPLQVSADVLTGTMVVSYAGYTMTGVTPHDVGADIRRPAQFMLSYVTNPTFQQYMGVCFTALGFSE